VLGSGAVRLRAARRPLPTLAAALLAAGPLACAGGAAHKMTFAEAGLVRQIGPLGAVPVEPAGLVLPPVTNPAPRSIASEIPEGPPVDATLLRFATDARGRRGRLPASSAFPDEVAGAWRGLALDLDAYLARALPQTPLLELVRARVTVEAEWDFDRRRFGTPPADLRAAVEARGRRLATRIETARALGLALFIRPPPARLRWPIEQAGLSSTFGIRIDPLDGLRRMHAGIDLAAERGRVVGAAASGWVVRSGFAGGYGLMVEVRHPGDVTTRYSHLSAILCGPGDAVDAGQPLGLVGRTGRATGPHLHFEVWRGGEPRDPLAWLGVKGSEGAAGN
jgi:murein DD-endopeptidase MepM/ murein hydrolase activator NlpD